ncbi:HAD-IIB family hydrolase [Spiroplasma taiwanense]|uniref:HAD superfamily hydrolase n=1 Tax=Spiroplasma taiwanense CT-1 TaxID=1276220 RepID=S5MBI8_9MOLU|nr:HAD-IIB family hydrolase [Spiroplasma taiwanense]AGR41138.1 hypothetical protein STAIW_v1c04990 [Spiroplasma taiwanense CT-1]
MKWWFSNYDGTLRRGSGTKIESEDLKFIEKFQSQNNKFNIATGNMLCDMKSVLPENLNYEFIITNNGNCIWDNNDKIIFSKSIDIEERIKILEILQNLNENLICTFNLLNERKSFIFKPSLEVSSKMSRSKYFNIFLPKIENESEAIEEFLTNENINCISIWGDDEIVKKILNILKPNLIRTKVMYVKQNLIEIIDVNTSKKTAIEYLQTIYNFDNDQIITSGDGGNDIEMLKMTKNSFAMLDGSNVAKIAANHIISRVHEIDRYMK